MASLARDGSDRPVTELPTVGVCRRLGKVITGLRAVVTAVLPAVDSQRVAQDSASAVAAHRSHHGGHAFDAVEARATPAPVDGERLVAICSAGNAHCHRKKPFLSGFSSAHYADAVHTLGRWRPNLFWQKSFLQADQPLWPAGSALRWCPFRFSGMVGDSAGTAQLLRPKRRQLRATCPVCGRDPDQGTAVRMP